MSNTTNKALIVRLSHDGWENKVHKLVEGLDREDVFVFYETCQAKTGKRSIKESPVFGALQFCVSFLLAIKSVGARDIMRAWHGKMMNDYTYSIDQFIVVVGAQFLYHLSKTSEAHKQAFKEIIKKYGFFDRKSLLCFIDSPWILHTIRFEMLSIALRFLDDLAKDDIYKNVIEDIWTCLGELDEEDVSTINRVKNIVTKFRDEENGRVLIAVAQNTVYKKYIILVGSAHATNLSNILTVTDLWITRIISKYDTDSLNKQLHEFLEV